MQRMPRSEQAAQLQTSPSNKQKLHGQQQLRLLQEEVRKQEEETKSQDLLTWCDFAVVLWLKAEIDELI